MPAAMLLVSGSAAAETLLEHSRTADKPSWYIKGDWESSAECEQRVASGGANTQPADSKAARMMVVGEDCRTSCKNWPAPEGHKWFGTAPSCTDKKMNKHKQAYRDCVDLGGEPVDWSYCGDGKPCVTGNKILCKMPTTEDFNSMVGFEGTVTWYGKAPACNANNGEKDCKAAGGTVARKSRCTDGSGGRKVDCCTTGKIVACVIPKVQVSVEQGGKQDAYVRWFGKPPACNANHGESDCRNLGGTVVTEDRCSDGSDGNKKKCCTTGKMVKCNVPKITGGQ